jgi:hypothetical protein
VRDEVGDPELAPAELAAEGVGRADVLHRAPQHAPNVRRRGRRRRRRLRPRLLLRRRRGRMGLGLGRGRLLLLVGCVAVVARRAVAHGCACAGRGSDEGGRM